MNWKNRIFEFANNLLSSKDRKKLAENCIIIIIIGVIAIIAGSTFFGSDKSDDKLPQNKETDGAKAVAMTVESDKNDDIVRVERILSQIEGAGKVSVMVTYYSSKELVPAQDLKKTGSTTQERDSGGGTRSIRQDDYQSNIVFEDGDEGKKRPVVLKELMPEVKGVVVVAEGAGNAIVRENLIRAVQVLMDVPIHKIQVFKKEK